MKNEECRMQKWWAGSDRPFRIRDPIGRLHLAFRILHSAFFLYPGQRQDAMAERGARQRIGHLRLDVFFAVRAGVAMDRVLGDDRLNLLRNVLDDAGAAPRAALQRSAAVGALLQPMLGPLIDALRPHPPRAGMPVPPTGPPTALAGGGFGVNRNHAATRGGRTLRRRRGLPLCQALRHGRHDPRDDFRTARVKPPNPGFVEFAAQRTRQQRIRIQRPAQHPCHATGIPTKNAWRQLPPP